MGCEGFNTTTDGNWSGTIDGNYIEVVNNGKHQMTNGLTREIFHAMKIMQILGVLEELFLAIKLEEVTGHEQKINGGALAEIFKGGKFESITGINTEVHVGPKYHVGVAGQTQKITEDQLVALEEKQVIAAYKEQLGAAYIRTTKALEDWNSLAMHVGSMKDTAKSMRREIGSLKQKHKKANMHCATCTFDISGELRFEAAKFKISSKGKVTLEGSSVALDGGGPVDVGGQLNVNGKAFA